MTFTKQHSNYEAALYYPELINIRFADDINKYVFVACSDKYEPETLVRHHGSSNLTLDQSTGYVSVVCKGVKLTIAKPSMTCRKNKAQFAKHLATWNEVLSDKALPLQGNHPSIVLAAIEPSGGDLFVIDPTTCEFIQAYQRECKIGGTKYSGMPWNSHTQAFQMLVGEVASSLVDGEIVLDSPFTTEEQEAYLLNIYAIRKFGSLAAMQAMAAKAAQKAEQLKNEGLLTPSVALYYNEKTKKWTEKYNLKEISVASRWTNSKW